MTDETEELLRKEIDELQLQVAGLRLVSEALCEDLWNTADAWPPKMAIAIPYGDPHPLQDFAGVWHPQHNTQAAKAMAEEGHQIAKAVGQEVARLKRLFGSQRKPKLAPF